MAYPTKYSNLRLEKYTKIKLNKTKHCSNQADSLYFKVQHLANYGIVIDVDNMALSVATATVDRLCYNLDTKIALAYTLNNMKRAVELLPAKSAYFKPYLTFVPYTKEEREAKMLACKYTKPELRITKPITAEDRLKAPKATHKKIKIDRKHKNKKHNTTVTHGIPVPELKLSDEHYAKVKAYFKTNK